MKAFWAVEPDGSSNFGDVLTALLVERLTGIRLEHAQPEEAELFGIGSIVESIPVGYTGFVLGSGCMFDRWVNLDAADVLALRGRLTVHAAGLPMPLLADLGLLAADLASSVERDVPIGTVRHIIDPRPAIGMALDSAGDPLEMIAAAARCQRIVSSSLHGLVLGDALGIPSMWDPYPSILGDGFKFHDYASAYGERIQPYCWRVADQVQVAEKQAALRQCLQVIAAQKRIA
jgi:pyruvyltransferase